jgi:hypothetical protein
VCEDSGTTPYATDHFVTRMRAGLTCAALCAGQPDTDRTLLPLQRGSRVGLRIQAPTAQLACLQDLRALEPASYIVVSDNLSPWYVTRQTACARQARKAAPSGLSEGIYHVDFDMTSACAACKTRHKSLRGQCSAGRIPSARQVLVWEQFFLLCRPSKRCAPTDVSALQICFKTTGKPAGAAAHSSAPAQPVRWRCLATGLCSAQAAM